MSRANEYRRKAEKAEEAAEKATDLVTKESFLEIAKQWRDLQRAADPQRKL